MKDPYLIEMHAFRRTTWEELRDTLPNLNGLVILLGKQGSRRLVMDVSKFTMEQWKTAAEGGYVYVLHGELWGFAADIDAQSKMPVLLQNYNEAFGIKPPPPEQGKLELETPTAGAAGTTQPS